MFIITLFAPRVKEGPLSAPRILTLCTIFGMMQGIEPELLRLQLGVLPMSYTHHYELHTSLLIITITHNSSDT